MIEILILILILEFIVTFKHYFDKNDRLNYINTILNCYNYKNYSILNHINDYNYPNDFDVIQVRVFFYYSTFDNKI